MRARAVALSGKSVGVNIRRKCGGYRTALEKRRGFWEGEIRWEVEVGTVQNFYPANKKCTLLFLSLSIFCPNLSTSMARMPRDGG